MSDHPSEGTVGSDGVWRDAVLLERRSEIN